jgi:hypothetical protein
VSNADDMFGDLKPTQSASRKSKSVTPAGGLERLMSGIREPFDAKRFEYAWRDGTTGTIYLNIWFACGRQGNTLVRERGTTEWMKEFECECYGSPEDPDYLVWNGENADTLEGFKITAEKPYPYPRWPREGVIPTAHEQQEHEREDRICFDAKHAMRRYLYFLKHTKPQMAELRSQPHHTDWRWMPGAEADAQKQLGFLTGIWTAKGIPVPTETEWLKLAGIESKHAESRTSFESQADTPPNKPSLSSSRFDLPVPAPTTCNHDAGICIGACKSPVYKKQWEQKAQK